jgi:hypothetical protein
MNALIEDFRNEIQGSLSREGKGGMTVSFRLASGTLALPGFAWQDETSSGLYRAGAGDWRLVVLGSAILKLLSSGVTITGTLDCATLDRAGTISLGTTSGTTVSISRAGQITIIAGTLDAGVIDRSGTVAIGTTSGTTVSISRSGQITIIGGTLDAAVIDRAGTHSIAATSGTTTTIGRVGQVVTFPGTVSAEFIDRSGSINVGAVNGTTLFLSRSGQTTAIGGDATVAGTLAVTGETSGPYTWRRVVTTGDVSCSSNVTAVDVTGLTFACASGKKYIARAKLRVWAAAGTTGLGISAKSTGAPTTSKFRQSMVHYLTSTTFVRYTSTAFADTPTALSDTSETTEPGVFDEAQFYFVTTGTGTFQLRLVSEVNLSAVNVGEGSYLEYMEFT